VEAENTKDLKVEMLLQGVMVRGLPTLILYHDGKPLAIHSGAISEEKLDNWLKEHLFSKDDIVMTRELSGYSAKLQTSNSNKETTQQIKRGFVSMTSQFGSDDYMLSSN